LKTPGLKNIKNVDPSIGLNNHIIVCEEYESIDIFIKSLRKKYLSRIIPIIILSPQRPSQLMVEKIHIYPEIYYVAGTPLNREDLKKCFIKNADKAIIYTKLEFNSQRQKMLSRDHKVLLFLTLTIRTF
jgi:hypothetical protein